MEGAQQVDLIHILNQVPFSTHGLCLSAVLRGSVRMGSSNPMAGECDLGEDHHWLVFLTAAVYQNIDAIHHA